MRSLNAALRDSLTSVSCCGRVVSCCELYSLPQINADKGERPQHLRTSVFICGSNFRKEKIMKAETIILIAIAFVAFLFAMGGVSKLMKLRHGQGAG
jgi:hypothetical protein